MKYETGMLFPAADKLFRIRNENRQLKKSHIYTQIGLTVAGLGLVINAGLQAMAIFGWFGAGASV